MSRKAWLLLFGLSILMFVIDVGLNRNWLGIWLSIWPVCFLAEWIRRALIGEKSLVLGYFFGVGMRVVIGLSLAMIFDVSLHGQLAANSNYWFCWLVNYFVCLVAETTAKSLG